MCPSCGARLRSKARQRRPREPAPPPQAPPRRLKPSAPAGPRPRPLLENPSATLPPGTPLRPIPKPAALRSRCSTRSCRAAVRRPRLSIPRCPCRRRRSHGIARRAAGGDSRAPPHAGGDPGAAARAPRRARGRVRAGRSVRLRPGHPDVDAGRAGRAAWRGCARAGARACSCIDDDPATPPGRGRRARARRGARARARRTATPGCRRWPRSGATCSCSSWAWAARWAARTS